MHCDPRLTVIALVSGLVRGHWHSRVSIADLAHVKIDSWDWREGLAGRLETGVLLDHGICFFSLLGSNQTPVHPAITASLELSLHPTLRGSDTLNSWPGPFI